MSSSPAAYYNLHLSNKIDDIAATPSESEQEQDPLSSIIDTEMFANSCNDEDFNDFSNNFVQVQVQETEPRHVSHLRDGLWSAVASPSTSKTDGNDDETTSTSNPTPTDTPDYTEKESKTAVTLKLDDNIGIGLDENMYFDEDEDEDEDEAMAQYGESENEKLCSSSTNTTNTKWDNNWQQKFSELQSFKRDNGHIDVSTSNENTRSLGFWLDRQKQFVRQYESTSTTNEVKSYKRRLRYDLLLSIGLTNLGARDVAWEMTFGELLAYRSKHHTCNVPTKGTNLGRWVSKMRKQYKTYHLRKEKPDGWNDKMESRYYRLKEAGFVFCAAENKK